MKLYSRGYTLTEVLFTTALIGVVGLIIYALLLTGTTLGAKNTAINTAHQQARMAMLEMVQDLHSAISLPQLIDENGAPLPAPLPGASPPPAQGISFQLWSHPSQLGFTRLRSVSGISTTSFAPSLRRAR
jgi:prepilin-type N-terminal cleavage/methylation domain-containing protein